jgi:proline racemase
MNTLGYMYMCGHATIGVAGALSKLGYIRMEEPETEISYETVAGIVNVGLHVKDSAIEKISVKASRKDTCVVQDHQCNQRIQTCVMVRLCESLVQSPT